MSKGFHSIHRIGSFAVSCHLVVSDRGVVLIDTGFVGHRWLISRKLRELGLAFPSIRAIALTHGHLDHSHNLAWLKARTGANVYAHPAEQAHIDGTFPYTDAARWCGRLENIGRAVFGSQTARIDQPLADGDELPFSRLRVVHLPGHTDGHCGFFDAENSLLFSGDLFASYALSTHLPPAFLNNAPALFPKSIDHVKKLNPARVVPNHYDVFSPGLHRKRFDRLCDRLAR